MADTPDTAQRLAEIRSQAEAVRFDHLPANQKDNGYERCALCSFTRHPCESYDLADELITALDYIDTLTAKAAEQDDVIVVMRRAIEKASALKAELQARAEKAEAERDEAVARMLLVENQREAARDERDRAEAERVALRAERANVMDVAAGLVRRGWSDDLDHEAALRFSLRLKGVCDRMLQPLPANSPSPVEGGQ